MELSKEWQKEAEKVSFCTTEYLNGATAYKQAVEAKIKEKRKEWEAEYQQSEDEVEKEQIARASIEFLLFIKELKILNPHIK